MWQPFCLCSQSCRYPLDTAAMEEGSSLAGHLSKIDPSRLMRLTLLSLTQCRRLLNTSWAWLELTNLLFLVLQVEQTFFESLHRLWTLSSSFLLPHRGILHQIYHCHWQVPSEALFWSQESNFIHHLTNMDVALTTATCSTTISWQLSTQKYWK